MDRIVETIGRKFRTFGGGQDVPISQVSPVSAALKDEPFKFALGVDVAAVVATVLEESGHDQLLEACKEGKQRISFLLRKIIDAKTIVIDGIEIRKTASCVSYMEAAITAADQEQSKEKKQ